MRILHLYPPRDLRGGVAVAAANYIRLSRELGHEVRNLDVASLAGVELLDAIARERPHLVHLHHLEHRLDAAVMRGIVTRFPSLSTAYDVSPLCLTGRKELPGGGFCDLPLGQHCRARGCPAAPSWGMPEARIEAGERDLAIKLDRLDALRGATMLVHSRYMREQYRRNGFPDDRLAEVLPVLAAPLAQTPAPAPETGLLLYVGRLDRNKGIYLLPQMLARLPRSWRLALAGSGREADWLRQVCRDQGVADRVEFLGELNGPDLWRVYDRANLLLVPSLVPESYCMAGVEAMSRGLPVLASRAGAIVDWMIDGHTGVLLPPGDAAALARAVLALGGDAAWLRRCREGALAHAHALFGADRVERQLAAAYEQALAAGLGHPAPSPARCPRLLAVGGQRVLVVAPHFDDEVLGCGGALALHRAAGDAVRVLYLSDGANSGAPGYGRERLMRLRRRESERALDHLGGGELRLLGLPDGGLAEVADLAERLRAEIADWNADLVYAPHPQESHPDHAAAGRAVLAAVGGRELRLYEVWTPLPKVDLVADIGPVLENKRAAIAEFHSQLAYFDYGHALLALNRHRGLALGRGEYAEAFALTALLPFPSGRGAGGKGAAAEQRTGSHHLPLPVATTHPRLVLVSESPNGPTGFGQVVRNLARAFHAWFEVILLVPHLWPGDLEEPYRIHPVDDRRDLLELLGHMDFELLLMIKDVYGNAAVGEAARQLREQGKRFRSIVYTPVEGELCHRHLEGMRGFEHLVLFNDYSLEQVRRHDPALAARAALIPHGCDTRTYFPLAAPRRAELRRALLPRHVAEEGRYVLLNINRNYQRKDLPRSLLILKEVLRREPRVYLHLHTNPGEGDYELIEIARVLGLSARDLGFSQQQFGRNSEPHAVDAASNADMARLYNCADLLITTSHGEGHGFSTTEAMACGIPVLAPDNTSFSGLLGDGRGFLVPCREEVDAWVYHAYAEPLPRAPVSVTAMADSIVALARGELDPAPRVAAALDYVRGLTWGPIRAQWRALFERILGRSLEP
ncbi:MAG: glycosyltransferase [Pseudomonadota bacterium]|nr:glycosyltransferase [Pseudomonadota bacterium]